MNASKAKDSRFWDLWKRSGAIRRMPGARLRLPPPGDPAWAGAGKRWKEFLDRHPGFMEEEARRSAEMWELTTSAFEGGDKP